MNGKVYWITGLSASGKTTIGTALYYKLKEKHPNVVILDGDILKLMVEGDNVGYSAEDRKKRAFKYSRICKMLAAQNMIVICCTISMFNDIRKWNRENIDNYYEIFIDTPFELLKQRDFKNIYGQKENPFSEGKLGRQYEFPANPDLTIVNDNSLSIEAHVNDILSLDKIKKSSTLTQKDVSYWNAFYQNAPDLNKPSDFAVFAIKYMEPGRIIDLGCGNGRDSIFFYRNGMSVTAIDSSKSAIEQLKNVADNNGILCVCDDFINSEILYVNSYNYAYSRFTLHAIGQKQQSKLLVNVYKSLAAKGKFFIEARSTKDELFGKGVKVGRNEFCYNNHHRRFIDIDELKNELTSLNFSITYELESQGCARFKDEDPVVIRIIAEK